MDELIKILIWVAIIFFVLKPLFKKPTPAKKLPTSEPESDSQAYGDLSSKESNPALSSSSQTKYDIMQEIENMFKGNTKVSAPMPTAQQSQKQVDPYDIYEPNKIKDEDLNLKVDERLQRDVMDHNPIGYRKSYDDNKTISKISSLKEKSETDTKIEEEAERFKKILSDIDKKSIPQSEFRNKIKNPVSIKDYIIFSEILGKPKALRR